MAIENRPKDDEEGLDSQKNICRFTIRGEAKPETAFDLDERFTGLEVMVAYCPKCRTFGDFYFVEKGEPIPEDYVKQECGYRGCEMKPVVVSVNYIRTLTRQESSEAQEIPSPQLGFDFGYLIREN